MNVKYNHIIMSAVNENSCLEETTNTTSTTTTTTATQNDEDKKIISMNKFFEFMNTSCRLNDLIYNGRSNLLINNNNNMQQTNMNSSNNNNNKTRKNCTFMHTNLPVQQQQQNKERYTTTGARRELFEIDLKKLAQNSLINNLYGYLQPQPQQQQILIQEDASDAQNIKDNKIKTFTQRVVNGLHPLLTDKLEYVINEGILDAVLPFICPTTLQSVANNNTRSNKNKNANNNNNNNLGLITNNTLVAKDSRLPSCSSISSIPANCSSLDNTAPTCQVADNEISAGVCTKLSFVANSNARRKSLGAGKSNCNLLPKE